VPLIRNIVQKPAYFRRFDASAGDQAKLSRQYPAPIRLRDGQLRYVGRQYHGAHSSYAEVSINRLYPLVTKKAAEKPCRLTARWRGCLLGRLTVSWRIAARQLQANDQRQAPILLRIGRVPSREANGIDSRNSRIDATAARFLAELPVSGRVRLNRHVGHGPAQQRVVSVRELGVENKSLKSC
jgi:hypothetical protein